MLDLNLISCGVASHVQLFGFGHLGGGYLSESMESEWADSHIR